MSKEAKHERLEKMIREALEEKDRSQGPSTPDDYRSQTSLRQVENNNHPSRFSTGTKIHPH